MHSSAPAASWCNTTAGWHCTRTASSSAPSASDLEGTTIRLRSSFDYRYVTPSTVRDKSTGDTGSAHRNAAHISDLRRYDRQPNVTATTPTTIDTAATTSTQVL